MPNSYKERFLGLLDHENFVEEISGKVTNFYLIVKQMDNKGQIYNVLVPGYLFAAGDINYFLNPYSRQVSVVDLSENTLFPTPIKLVEFWYELQREN